MSLVAEDPSEFDFEILVFVSYDGNCDESHHITKLDVSP